MQLCSSCSIQIKITTNEGGLYSAMEFRRWMIMTFFRGAVFLGKTKITNHTKPYVCFTENPCSLAKI